MRRAGNELLGPTPPGGPDGGSAEPFDAQPANWRSVALWLMVLALLVGGLVLLAIGAFSLTAGAAGGCGGP